MEVGEEAWGVADQPLGLLGEEKESRRLLRSVFKLGKKLEQELHRRVKDSEIDSERILNLIIHQDNAN